VRASDTTILRRNLHVSHFSDNTDTARNRAWGARPIRHSTVNRTRAKRARLFLVIVFPIIATTNRWITLEKVLLSDSLDIRT
jgi:hypothetical protein